jgi:hypothetical protein
MSSRQQSRPRARSALTQRRWLPTAWLTGITLNRRLSTAPGRFAWSCERLGGRLPHARIGRMGVVRVVGRLTPARVGNHGCPACCGRGCRAPREGVARYRAAGRIEVVAAIDEESPRRRRKRSGVSESAAFKTRTRLVCAALRRGGVGGGGGASPFRNGSMLSERAGSPRRYLSVFDCTSFSGLSVEVMSRFGVLTTPSYCGSA